MMTTGSGMPAAEVTITAGQAARLISDQYRPVEVTSVRSLAHGWDNLSLLVEDRWVARFPRRAVAVPLLHNEARWLPEIARRVALPVPSPIFVGEPGEGYPWPWSLAPFIAGEPAAIVDRLDEEACAGQLGGFLAQLHTPAPEEAPRNPYRGGPLTTRLDSLSRGLAILGASVDRAAVEAVFDEAVDADSHQGPPVWLHGDLHPNNLLVVDHRLSGIVDFGDITAGDPATDLAVAWMLLSHRHHAMLRSAYATSSEATWMRARGWAISLAITYLANSADQPVLRRIGETTLSRALTG